MTPSFPPLMSGQAVTGATDPFEKARVEATLGCDAGLIVYNLGADLMRAALVLAPEVPLREAVAMLPVCGVGFQNALGALAPPEVAVHLEWSGAIRINGARCGGLRMAAATTDIDAQPDWLVIGLNVPLWPASDDPGETPDETALYAEGCADVEAPALLEAWAKHSLVSINRWADEGNSAIHSDWRALAHGIGEPFEDGTYLGVDEHFGMLLRRGKKTDLIPLTDVLEI